MRSFTSPSNSGSAVGDDFQEIVFGYDVDNTGWVYTPLTPADAAAFFNGNFIDFGPYDSGYQSVLLSFAFTAAGDAPGYFTSFDVAGRSTQAAPEPSTWAMMCLGFAGLGFLAYRKRTAAAGA